MTIIGKGRFIKINRKSETSRYVGDNPANMGILINSAGIIRDKSVGVFGILP